MMYNLYCYNTFNHPLKLSMHYEVTLKSITVQKQWIHVLSHSYICLRLYWPRYIKRHYIHVPKSLCTNLQNKKMTMRKFGFINQPPMVKLLKVESEMKTCATCERPFSMRELSILFPHFNTGIELSSIVKPNLLHNMIHSLTCILLISYVVCGWYLLYIKYDWFHFN